MKKGDLLRVQEPMTGKNKHKTKTTEGEILQIDDFKITITVVKKGIKAHNTSFNRADLTNSKNKFYINEGEGWKKINITIKKVGD